MMAALLSCTTAVLYLGLVTSQAISIGSSSCPPLQNSPSNHWIIAKPTRKTAISNGQTLTATIECNEGFRTQHGSKFAKLKVTCRDGKWTSTSTRCRPEGRYRSEISRNSRSCDPNAIDIGRIRGSPRIDRVNQTHALLGCPHTHYVEVLGVKSGQPVRTFYFQCVDGEWQSPYDIIPKNELGCSRVKCSTPFTSRDFNVRVVRNGSATTYGVGCLLGYRCRTESRNMSKNGEALAECLPSGQWSLNPSQLNCSETRYKCGQLKRFQGSRIDYGVNETHALIECPMGYHAVPRGLAEDHGKRTFFVRCENRVWDSPYVGTDISDFGCKRTSCDSSNLIQSNMESMRVCINVTVPNTVGDCVRYSCTSQGYYLTESGDGSATIYCLENGEWSQNPAHFQCKPSVSCNSSELVQPALVNTLACPEAVKRQGPGYCEDFVCRHKGHYVNGKKKITVHCLQNGTWSQDPSNFHCRECGRLQRQFRVTPRIDYGLNATHVLVECPPTHHAVPRRLHSTNGELSRSFYFKCVDGTWASPYNGVLENQLDCSRTTCDRSSTTRDLNQGLRCPSGRMYGVGCYMDYTCRRKGYRIAGKRNMSIKCLENGKWSRDATKFKCQKCGPIRNIGGSPVIDYVNETHAHLTCPGTHRAIPQHLRSGNREQFRSFYLECKKGTWKSPYKGIEYHELDCQPIFCNSSSFVQENIDIKPCADNQSPAFGVGYCLEGRCRKNYYLLNSGRKQDKIICQSNGQWNQDISLFKCGECGPIPRRFRVAPKIDYSVNVTHAFIECPPNHHAVPLSISDLDDNKKRSFYFKCDKGNWTSPYKGVPREKLDCLATTCDVPIIHPNTPTCPPGQSLYTAGCTVKQRCKDTRHYINGWSTLTIYCLSNGQWNRDPTQLYCRKCGPVPTLNGSPSVDYGVNKTHVLVNCPPTHHAVPQPIQPGSTGLFKSFYFKCVDGQWTSPYDGVLTQELDCRPITCDNSSLVRRNVDITTCTENQSPPYAVGYCLEYQCHNNYLLLTSGKPLGRIYCLRNGKWSQDPTLFQCRGCGPIRRQFRITPTIDYNANATHALVQCLSGHHAEPLQLPQSDKGSFYLKCVAGSWESPYPGIGQHELDCSKTVCDYAALFRIDININVRLTCPGGRSDYGVGCSAQFSCRKRGYHLNGQSNATMHCLPNGQWSKNPGQLHCRQCGPITFLTGSPSIDYSINETHVRVTCPETHHAVIGSQSTLTSFYLMCVHGQWTSSYNGINNPDCQPKNPCSLPSMYPYNVQILSTNISSSSQQSLLSILMWGCKEGYKSVANNSQYIRIQRCNTVHGQWEPRIETTDLRYLCRPVRHCDSGVFNAVARKDMIVTGSCEFAAVYTAGHCVDIRCYHRGYLIEGNQTYTVRCQADGTWDKSPEVLQCAPKNACPRPLTENYPNDVGLISPVTLPEQQPMVKLVWKCIGKKQPEKGSRKFIQRCNAETGNWEPALDLMPRCVPRNNSRICSYPGDGEFPENARLDHQSSSVRGLVWQCIKGYETHGPMTQNCTKGEWEPEIDFSTSCKKKVCNPLPPQHQNVIVTPSSKIFYPGDNVTFECKPGTPSYKFKSKGEPRLVCNETGQWNFTESKAYNCFRVFAFCSIPASLYDTEGGPVQAGTTITLKGCPPGQYRPEPLQLSCRLNAYFDKQWKPCQKITCTEPLLTLACEFDPPLQGDRLSYDQGTQLSYTVNRSKVRTGKITCGEDGKWTYKHAMCDPGDLKKGSSIAKS